MYVLYILRTVPKHHGSAERPDKLRRELRVAGHVQEWTSRSSKRAARDIRVIYRGLER